MLGAIRRRIGTYAFMKEVSHHSRQKRMLNLMDARHIGIVYTLEDVPDYEKVSEFVAELQHDHKEVKALGFVKNRELISRFLPRLSFDFFSKKDMTWFYKPIHATVRDFISREFDILIDLSLQDSFPLRYICGLSKSYCKVGRFSEENAKYYDFMIDPKANVGFDEYLGYVKHYLTIINREKGIEKY